MIKLHLIGFTAASAVLLAGCATPAGQFQESDMHWSTRTVPLSYQAAHRNLSNGLRKCGSLVAEGQMYDDIKEGALDLYLPNILGGRSPWVFGHAKIKSIDDKSSSVTVGINTKYDGQGKDRDRLIRLAAGEPLCDS